MGEQVTVSGCGGEGVRGRQQRGGAGELFRGSQLGRNIYMSKELAGRKNV